jgi:hypothetical protein
MRRELALVLPGVDVGPGLLTVPTSQRSVVDLADWGDVAAREKDLLLERFAAWAGAVCDRLAARGHWADFVDPCSGLLVRTPNSNVRCVVGREKRREGEREEREERESAVPSSPGIFLFAPLYSAGRVP